MIKNAPGFSPLLFFAFYFSLLVTSCSVNKQISKQANRILLSDSAIMHGHIGISIYEPATGKFWYGHDAEKYFIPASNTKLFTLYAGMKYLGDSLVGIRYNTAEVTVLGQKQNPKALLILPAADPTFLHQEFKDQPVEKFLKSVKANYDYLAIEDTVWKDNRLGKGWAWDDYNEDYMVERSSFPVYGNTVLVKSVKFNQDSQRVKTFYEKNKNQSNPKLPDNYLETTPVFFEASVNNRRLQNDFEIYNSASINDLKFEVKRLPDANSFFLEKSETDFIQQRIPFYTSEDSNKYYLFQNHSVASKILSQQFDFKEINLQELTFKNYGIQTEWRKIYSQPSDSLFKPMMHRSDNFFAEQTLLMASNEHLGYMNAKDMIESLLDNDLKNIPQKPKWVDGSGLSRYNLVTPQSIVFLLNKMKEEFDWERIKNILPTGGEGTLTNYFKTDAGYIFAKTGTLSNNCALSGFLITKKGKLLVFSVLANNYITGASPVRKAVEQFLKNIRLKY